MTDVYVGDRENIEVKLRKERGLTIRHIQDVPKHRSADNSRDIDSFLVLVAQAFEDYQYRQGIARDKWVPVKYIRPKEHVESPDGGGDVILFKVISRKRFNTSPTTDRRPWKPEFRESKVDEDDPENIVSIWGLRKEHIVEFAIWSKHSRRANELAIMFEEFFDAYIWYFKDRGILQMYFEDRGEDHVEEIGSTEYSIRPIRYNVTTELLYRKVDKAIKGVILEFDIGSKLKTEVVNEETDLVEMSIDRGE